MIIGCSSSLKWHLLPRVPLVMLETGGCVFCLIHWSLHALLLAYGQDRAAVSPEVMKFNEPEIRIALNVSVFGQEPDFLKNTSAIARNELKQLVSNKTLTIAQLKEKISDWIDQQPKYVQAEYRQDIENMEISTEAFYLKIANSELSDEAREAYKTLLI
ncbi:unnamed protein product [Gongylonema pulchrum]|uniref:DUF4168 domain-containing protein n=1 Tax=Gongylonema pulchrum TaxID=637853 RepID=A0A183DZM2_9BILA|nr:unnamed protein product [Gongylonema pulchrum]